MSEQQNLSVPVIHRELLGEGAGGGRKMFMMLYVSPKFSKDNDLYGEELMAWVESGEEDEGEKCFV